MDVKKNFYIKSPNRMSEKDLANKFKKIQAEIVSEKKELPVKNKFQYDQEREKLANEFRANANVKKNIEKLNLTQAPVLGREKEQIWNQPLENEELSQEPFEDDLMPVMSDQHLAHELRPKSENPATSPNMAVKFGPANHTNVSKTESKNENNFVVVIDGNIIFTCAEEKELKEYVENLLLQHEQLSTDDIIVMKRLKLSTGIILE